MTRLPQLPAAISGRVQQCAPALLPAAQEPRRRAEQAQQAKQRCLEAVAGAPEEVVQLLEAINPANLVEHGQFYREQETCT